MICFEKITNIFCIVYEFCTNFDKITQYFLLGRPSEKPHRISKSKVITICLLFHLSGFRFYILICTKTYAR